MLFTPRTYSASQTRDQTSNPSGIPKRLRFSPLSGWHLDPTDADRVTEMLLTRQSGSVRVGEVIRYTLTYTPATDEIQPPPAALHVKIKNTSAIPLRAAYLHGPYTLYASCYPHSFNSNSTTIPADPSNVPQFEPYVKAGGTWNARIPILSHDQRAEPGILQEGYSSGQNTTWVIEIISQVVFSNTASVNFELLVGRDEMSLDLPSFNTQFKPPKAANLRDHWPSGSKGKQLLATKGVYSDSVHLLIDDTASLWNTPQFPMSCDNDRIGNVDSLAIRPPVEADGAAPGTGTSKTVDSPRKPRKKVHLVVLTHGLHSNLGADMLYLKESIDATFQKSRSGRNGQSSTDKSMPGPSSFFGSCNVHGDDDDDYRGEHIIVRGFPGNAARTERGIQYLGKRLAKYVLLMTYPDQPHLPCKKSKSKGHSNPFVPRGGQEVVDRVESSRIDEGLFDVDEHHHAYQITSISFIGHSLGGLVQTYAIAYIQKHSPKFFDKIKPVNFIALATPFLGLSNENPMYVRFALDFGLVGRTGQDLGLSWTAPRVRSGWDTIIGGKGEPSRPRGDENTRSKPLLRILPSGPAHEVLVKFKRRTVYSNLVNDGIVPLRTSCLLYLDWKGLQRVEKARRENGIVGTMAEWGWSELTGANSKSPKYARPAKDDLEMTCTPSNAAEIMEETSETMDAQRGTTTQHSSFSTSFSPIGRKPSSQAQPLYRADDTFINSELDGPPPHTPSTPLSGLFSVFKPKEPKHKQEKFLKRTQTIPTSMTTELIQQGGSYLNPASRDAGFNAPPKTTVFESARDILMPPLPPVDYIVNPASRQRVIMHDRIYHPEDIPPPILKPQKTGLSTSHDGISAADHASAEDPANETGLKVEEKIARGYHRGLSWRKVLVRLEPDAHNNIIVRRMFTNAYGWPVVQHLVDAHFGPDSLTSEESICEDVPTSPAAEAKDCCHDHTQLAPVVLNGST